MSSFVIKEKEGSLFSNKDNKKTEKHPDYTGSCVISGTKLNISAWVNESQSGKKYMRLKFDEFKGSEASNSTPEPKFNSSEADVPF
tara:strand:- start:391 stop:648 length:258 start_codon:yes stop_codon:yes gene_type:complete